MGAGEKTRVIIWKQNFSAESTISNTGKSNKIRLRNKKGSWDFEITRDLCTAVSGEQQSGTLMQET